MYWTISKFQTLVENLQKITAEVATFCFGSVRHPHLGFQAFSGFLLVCDLTIKESNWRNLGVPSWELTYSLLNSLLKMPGGISLFPGG